MHFTTSLIVISPLLASFTSAVCLPGSHKVGRHHRGNGTSSAASPSGTVVAADRAGADGSSTRAWGSRSSTTSASSSTATSSSSSSVTTTCRGVSANGICVGILPDDGSGGSGSVSTSIQALNSQLGGTLSYGGYYAQVSNSDTWNGAQLTDKMTEIVSSGAIFQPAVMPTGGWGGFTSSNNYQAVAVCKVMKQFTDQGVEVWLRFAHEMNWYQYDGTYPGGVSDFQEGWATVAAACRVHAPLVKMYWTPNVDNAAAYAAYWPKKAGDVDVVGVDWYPTGGISTGMFAQELQAFHDLYTSSTVKMAQGETGLGADASVSDRLAWLKEITSTNTANKMKNMIAVSWFNYYKGYDFRVIGTSGTKATATYLGL